jgi:hypothetical protein
MLRNAVSKGSGVCRRVLAGLAALGARLILEVPGQRLRASQNAIKHRLTIERSRSDLPATRASPKAQGWAPNSHRLVFSPLRSSATRSDDHQRARLAREQKDAHARTLTK